MKAIDRVKKQPVIKITAKEELFPIVAIGASVGGLEAMSLLLKNLPADTGMAFIYVQHLSPDHKSLLTSILSKITKMNVQEITDMEHMEPNHVYVIPHDKGIQVTDGHIKLLPRPKNSATNLSIDVLFSSLSLTHGNQVIGVILSGNANDGTEGLKAIKKEGGITFAQDHSAHATSMPNSAIAAGVVDFVLPPKEIARKLIEISKRTPDSLSSTESGKLTPAKESSTGFQAIFDLLFKKTGVDFSHYKMSTIKRRLNHRMLHLGIKTPEEYVKVLLGKSKEVEELYNDLLINVTSFFRDADVFRYLKGTFLPKLLKQKEPDETLRIWVAACSTGQEAYSLAMMLTELQEQKDHKIPFQIFATDLSEQAIRTARIGDYSLEDLKNVSKRQKERFFIKTGEKYRVIKELRETCVFAPHNVLRDPPFSRIDFVSCCNLLIYFDTAAQKKVFSTLHFAMRENGFLMLGKAESVGTSSPLFSRINNKFKIYSRKKHTGVRKIPELIPRFPRANLLKLPIHAGKTQNANPSGIANAVDTILLAKHMPACAVVNKEMEILELRGPFSQFLEHPPGKASLNILKMTRPEFAFELRDAIQKVIKTKKLVTKSDIELKIDSVSQRMSIEVSLLKIEWDEPLLLVVFTLQGKVENEEASGKSKGDYSNQKDKRIDKLSEELSKARKEMNAVIESQEATYEELQAANEEIVSTNEEFQTLNEELETSKEEIEATNEELLSTNQELQTRHDLLTESYEYSEAIIATIHEPMLVLNKDLHVKSANKSFYDTFLVKKQETEGVFLFDLGNKQWDIPKLRGLLNDIVSNNTSFNNFEVNHTFPGIGEKIMRLNAHRIIQKVHSEQLILLAVEDVTERTLLAVKEQELQKKENQISDLAVKSKQQFLSNMSHEIRTPMNSILGFTNVVLKTKLSDEQKQYINAIKVSGDALLVLINDILDLAKVDAGKMTFEQTPFNLEESVSSMLYLFETKFQEKNLKLIKQFDPAIPSVLVGDPVRLRQIVLNLISNAIKFTSQGSITLNVRLLTEDDKDVKIEFSVTDTGIGIPESQLALIFDNFQQANDHTSGTYGGTGLGLAIVKQLVELQDGQLKVISKEGVGSTFSFTLHFSKTEIRIEPERKQITNAPIGLNRVKILVVDDSAMNQLLMKTLLEDFGFEFDMVDNGRKAIENLERNTYDVVLMDLHMPEMNGFQATTYIRDTLQSNVPIIALTADVTTVDMEKCKSFGMNDYLSKPIDESLLYKKIVQYLDKSRDNPSIF